MPDQPGLLLTDDDDAEKDVQPKPMILPEPQGDHGLICLIGTGMEF